MPENNIFNDIRNTVETRRDFTYVLETFADHMQSFIESYMYFQYDKETGDSFYSEPNDSDYNYKRYLIAKDLAKNVLDYVLNEYSQN